MTDAARRGLRVRAVRAFEPPRNRPSPVGSPRPPTLEELTARLEAGAHAMVESVSADPGTSIVPVDVVAIPGSPAKVLLHQTRDADLLVLGHRGRGALASATLGSVGLACVLHATCPVTIVRTGRRAAREQGDAAGPA